jgi:hypothetical protein
MEFCNFSQRGRTRNEQCRRGINDSRAGQHNERQLHSPDEVHVPLGVGKYLAGVDHLGPPDFAAGDYHRDGASSRRDLFVGGSWRSTGRHSLRGWLGGGAGFLRPCCRRDRYCPYLLACTGNLGRGWDAHTTHPPAPERLQTSAGRGVLVGVAMVIAGVLVCAIAGRMRENALNHHSQAHKSSALGIALAILCGFGASFINLGLAFGGRLTEAARDLGATELNAANAVWMPLMLAGSIPNLMYCLWLLRKNRTSHKFARGGSGHWGLALVMAVLWLGSTLLYGVSAAKLGTWGPVLGWPLFMSLIVITASLLGMITGEWKNSGRLPIGIQWSGVALLVIAVFILAGMSRRFS